jgi:hypothetical protein
MSLIDEILEPYAELENSVNLLMKELFSETCGMCTACCCRADICEEAIESAFLSKLLKRQGLGSNDMDDRYGWLDLNGCSLDYGRPPICYAYFCDQLISRLPDDDTRLAARKLGQIMDHVGKDALGDWNLVDIKHNDDLDKVSVDQLFQRLGEAQTAFQIIEQYMQSGRFNRADREILAALSGHRSFLSHREKRQRQRGPDRIPYWI